MSPRLITPMKPIKSEESVVSATTSPWLEAAKSQPQLQPEVLQHFISLLGSWNFRPMLIASLVMYACSVHFLFDTKPWW